MKKLTALLLSILMIIGAIAGCANNDPIETTPTIETEPQPTRPTTLSWEFSEMELPQINWGEEGPDSLSTCLGEFDELDKKIQNSDLLKSAFTSVVVEDETVVNENNDHTDNEHTHEHNTEESENVEETNSADSTDSTEQTEPVAEKVVYRSKTYVCSNDKMRVEIKIEEDLEYFENVSCAEVTIYLLSDESFTTEHQSLITSITKLVYGEHIGEYVALAKDSDGKYANENDIQAENISTGMMSERIQVGLNYNVTLSRTTNIPSIREQMFISVMFTHNND